jgi:uncharacterized membrane protein
MSAALAIIGVASLIGAALIAGTFYAFSTFIMKALGQLSAAEGIRAMQSINVVVINRWFLGVFMGTAVLSLTLVVLALVHVQPGSIWMISGGLAYVLGTFLVTVIRNVPLNNELARAKATESASNTVWAKYLAQWTLWNHVRTGFAVLSILLIALGNVAIAA